MRAEIFKAIRQRLRDKVAYIDLWNDNMANIESGVHFPTPAVFIEFESIDWVQGTMGTRRGEVSVILHIIDRRIPTDGSRDDFNPLAYLQKIDDINDTLWGMTGQHFSSMMLKTSSTDHNFAELIHDMERWVCSAVTGKVRDDAQQRLTSANVKGEITDDGLL